MATGGSSPGTIYSPLPQSISDADTTEDEEEEEELNSVGLAREGENQTQKSQNILPNKGSSDGRNGRGRLGRGAYQPLGGSDITLNGMTSQLGFKGKDPVREADINVSQPPPLILPAPETPSMSTPRRACFFFSISLCFLVVIGFLFVLPCDLPPCISHYNNFSNSSNASLHSSDSSTLRSVGGSWEKILPGIELKGRVHLVQRSTGMAVNMVFLVRGQLSGLFSSIVASPPSLSLISSSTTSSNCTSTPIAGSGNASSLGNLYPSASSIHCSIDVKPVSNYTSNSKSSDMTNFIDHNSSSLFNEKSASAAGTHYRSKRILDNSPDESEVNMNESFVLTDDIDNTEQHSSILNDSKYSSDNISSVEINRQEKEEKVWMKEDKAEKHTKPRSERSPSFREKGVDSSVDPRFLGALIGGGGLVSLSGATGQPLWQVALPSPPEELDCGFLDTDGDGIPDCLAFAGRSGLLAAVHPTTGAVIWYLHDHKSQMRPTALQFPVSVPDLDGDGTNEIAVACILPNPPPMSINRNLSNKITAPSPYSSAYSAHQVITKGTPSKSPKKELIYSSSNSDFPIYKSPRPLPSPSSSPDTVTVALASGKSGSIIGQPLTPSGCATISSITLNVQTLTLFYRCINENGDETGESISVEELYGEKLESTSTPLPPSTSSIPSIQMLKHQTHISSSDATPSPSSAGLNPLPSFSPFPSLSSNSQRHSTTSSAWVSDHRLLVENHGHCHSILLSPMTSSQTPPCSVSVRLTDSRNATLWAHEGVLAHAMDPVPLLFRQPRIDEMPEGSSSSFHADIGGSDHPVSGFVLKFWQWSVPKGEHVSDLKDDDKNQDVNTEKTPGGPNSLFRTRLKRSKAEELILPPMAAAAASSSGSSEIHNHTMQNKRQSPIGNLPHHGGLFPGTSGKKKPKGSYYKSNLAPIVNQLKERVVLITFNDTGLHVINASQSDITQLCERYKGMGGSGKKRGKGAKGKDRTNNADGSLIEQKLRCQPELAFQEQSLLVADLDKDGYQELVSYLTTYVDSRKEDPEIRSHGNPPKWRLESRVKVVLLEAELPKLYEAVAAPGS